MQLEYRILWIEDDPDFVDSVKEDLNDFISEKGFIPIIKLVKKEELKTILDENLRVYDLFLIDYKLSAGSYSQESGEKLIERIRQKKFFNNIIFYSSEFEKIKSFNLPGVFVLDRGAILVEDENDFCSMIAFFLEKDMNLNTMRGIAMSEVAKYDQKIITILKEHCPKEKLCEVTKEGVKKFNESVQKKSVNKLWKDITGSSGTVYFSSGPRSEYFFSTVKIKGEENSQLPEIYKDVLTKRNKLAHQENVNFDLVELRKQMIQIRQYFDGMNS